ncbi:hypothetical protein QEH52_18630 [Coraliomargarita sp. SDUM461003]|uniref:Uncharacterized protein n=1 Tax=Thalassobacterium maritimum TaxID=3041265 RepID=A0ABU1AZI0_9BACT|nr:hypothetical protein [Coraliomargarita sp. SDUM461003]MBT62001.1 hypothetical protein [Puniceicoccaceae bacterium]MDQ8209548.1 hypothetical protein [Coraliomargarita sp. SDUM461003]|tara:strand:- start:99 stop:401 length:303 start_codon:yes stop_codon:yes gene_type:complete
MNNENESLESKVEEILNEPTTTKDIVIGAILGLTLIGYCAAVWLNPGLLDFDGEGPSGKGGRKVVRVMGWIWNRPVASIGGLFGLLITFGTISSIFKKQK